MNVQELKRLFWVFCAFVAHATIFSGDPQKLTALDTMYFCQA